MPGQNLTRDEARNRSQLLDVRGYDVALDVSGAIETERTTFDVTSRVRFSCARPGALSFIDWIGSHVHRVVLNDRDLCVTDIVSDGRIALPDLAADNELLVTAAGRYMNTGEGLHRFVDPVDDRTYLYTQFEVADARRAFPCFDQPDLKAEFTFTVTAPASWTVISTMTTPEPSRDGDVATWRFAPTPRLSTYVTAIIAGPYEHVESSVTVGDGRVVPLGLYARGSLFAHLDADQVFDVTRRGFAFFEEEFGLAYPFEKYDQIFTPEYNAGAMENVGAVTFTEAYVFRSKVTEATVERRALTIMHELAHMWFGNLVTMSWWDDLWLNESFAEWAATVALVEATRWQDAWTTFSADGKAWAYQQDQLSSTHPVAADMRHLDDVAVNFDGITYAKGASVLKALVAYVGREAFVAGLQAYFATHAYGTTTLGDLLVELERTSGRDLGEWTRLWLQTAGVTTARLQLDVDAGDVITAAEVTQTAPATHPSLRPHRMAIGVYDIHIERPVRRERVEVDVAGERTPVPDLVGVARGDLMLLNDDDLAYTKIRLDDRSLATAVTHAAGLDSLPRALVLTAMWDMTRDAELPARAYASAALRVLGQTDVDPLDSSTLRSVLGRLGVAGRLYSDPAHRPVILAQIAAGLRDLALRAAPGSDAQLQLVTSFATFAASEADLDLVESWLEGAESLAGLEVDTEMRWGLLRSLAAGGRAGQDRIDAEAARDATATGRERAAQAGAAIPTPEAKEAAWTRAVVEGGVPNQTVDALAAGWAHVHDATLLAPYVERYPAMLLPMWQTSTLAIGESIVEGFYPLPVADERLLTVSEEWLDAHGDHAPQGLVRLVGERRDAARRALLAQACDAAATSPDDQR